MPGARIGFESVLTTIGGIMSDIDLKASELVLELEKLGLYGLGYFAGLLVERKPNMAEQLRVAIEVNQEEIKS
jgi:hypothetical protein